MDTREKILPLDQIQTVLESGEWVVVVGEFDPLTAVQAKRLSTLQARGRRLLAVIVESGQALLSGEARATLIAALRDVDAVTVSEPELWRAIIANAAHVRLVEDAEAEKGRSAEFIRYIVDRQATVEGRSQ